MPRGGLGGHAPRAFWGSAAQSCPSWGLPFILTLEGLHLLVAAEANFVLKGLLGWPRRPGLATQAWAACFRGWGRTVTSPAPNSLL